LGGAQSTFGITQTGTANVEYVLAAAQVASEYESFTITDKKDWAYERDQNRQLEIKDR